MVLCVPTDCLSRWARMDRDPSHWNRGRRWRSSRLFVVSRTDSAGEGPNQPRISCQLWRCWPWVDPIPSPRHPPLTGHYLFTGLCCLPPLSLSSSPVTGHLVNHPSSIRTDREQEKEKTQEETPATRLDLEVRLTLSPFQNGGFFFISFSFFVFLSQC